MPVNLFLNELKNNPNSKILIGLPGFAMTGSLGSARGVLEAEIVENTNFSAHAGYTDPGSAVFGPAAGAAEAGSKAWNIAVGLGARNYGSNPNFAQRQIRTVHSTISTWENHKKLSFTLRLAFYATKRDVDVTGPVKILMRCCHPIKDSTGLTMIAPNYYDTKPETLISLSIGRWFETPPLFLIENVDFSISKEIISGGLPLYAEGSVTFLAYKALFADEIVTFFKKPNITTTVE
ncbi:MAG: hypothetical protein WC511_02745 [Candidatus Pacearchaeota archaeon]